MQRANHVRPSPDGRSVEMKKKSPSAFADGPLKQRIAERASISGNLVNSLRTAAQVRDVIGGLQRIDDRLAAGVAIERTHDLLNFYRAVWEIFEELGCHAAEDRARRDFEAMTGVRWVWFAAALDAFGFALLTPTRRHALYKTGGGVTRGDVEGWSEPNE